MGQPEEVMDVENPSLSIWAEHVKGAVRSFLKNVVVIDNQPSYSITDSTIDVTALPVVNNSDDSGLGDEVPELIIPEERILPPEINELDIRKVSDVFTEKGIACAFVLPYDNDNDRDAKKKRALTAAQISDLVVIDWYLEPKSSALTLEILQEIAASDSKEKGRLRLICVYTGEPLTNAIYSDVKKYMADGGIELIDDDQGAAYCGKSAHTLVVLKNKCEVPAENLPDELIDLFSKFADGLIPAFALAAVGAIRQNAHHMLTRFGKNLDPAYVVNRLITDPPGDVSELMRELFVSECDIALGLERVADHYLENIAVKKWLATNQERIEQIRNVNEFAYLPLLYNILSGDQKVKSKKIPKLSEAVAGSDEVYARAQNEFARMVVFKREASGHTKLKGGRDWVPSLTTGTLLKYELPKSEGEGDTKFEYLICLTPACDTLRLKSEKPFVFMLAEPNSEQYGLILKEGDSNETLLHLASNPPVIKTFFFDPDKAIQRVLGKNKSECEGHPDFIFTDNEGKDFIWLGEVRYMRAVSEIAKITGNWMRIGINDSEYLRLISERRLGN